MPITLDQAKAYEKEPAVISYDLPRGTAITIEQLEHPMYFDDYINSGLLDTKDAISIGQALNNLETSLDLSALTPLKRNMLRKIVEEEKPAIEPIEEELIAAPIEENNSLLEEIKPIEEVAPIEEETPIEDLPETLEEPVDDMGSIEAMIEEIEGQIEEPIDEIVGEYIETPAEEPVEEIEVPAEEIEGELATEEPEETVEEPEINPEEEKVCTVYMEHASNITIQININR